MKTFLIFLISYLIGSIPNAYIVAKIVKKIDIRSVGEGNVGARNVWHVVSPFWGIFVFFLDFLKGVITYLISFYFLRDNLLIWLCGIFAVIGHGFPIFLKFRGGKGMAIASGFLFSKFPECVLMGTLLYLILFLLTKNFHLSITIAIIITLFVFYPLFKEPFNEIIMSIFFLILLGIKRIIDEPYMRKIKAQNSYWK
ncbi:MAG: glycerol-3-phosphate acyltransferase [candidate division WOR-3 bacterium]